MVVVPSLLPNSSTLNASIFFPSHLQQQMSRMQEQARGMGYPYMVRRWRCCCCQSPLWMYFTLTSSIPPVPANDVPGSVSPGSVLSVLSPSVSLGE